MNRNAQANRLIWILVFLAGSTAATLFDIEGEQLGTLGWFLFTGLWSAFCGIGYSLCDWFIRI